MHGFVHKATSTIITMYGFRWVSMYGVRWMSIITMYGVQCHKHRRAGGLHKESRCTLCEAVVGGVNSNVSHSHRL